MRFALIRNVPFNARQVEPPAGMRDAAKHTWAMFVAYRQQGFTEDQAMALVLTMLEQTR